MAMGDRPAIQNHPRVSIRDHTLSLAADGRSLFEALRDLGLGAVELQVDPDLTTPHLRQTNGVPFSADNDAAVVRLQETLSAQAVRVSALLLMTDFSSEHADDHIAWSVRAIRLAEKLGAPVVRLDPLTRDKELPRQVVRDNFIVGVRRIVERTPDSTIDIGIENHGPIGNDPVFLDAIFAAVDHPRLGITLDTGNFYWWGVALDDLYILLERYAPRTRHTHIKNINYPPALANTSRPIGSEYAKYCCPLDEGNIDLRRVARILEKAGYRRDLCIENESLQKYAADQKFDVLRRDVQAIKAAFL
ncbi:MAG TPA: sugar phosphate isomerase/epimerase family protein [Tepidisphaeraceae bacterium]|nr:sugar phosphate isomerase/epimerase family protein [Tepidisphaeraceae bacterium]